MRVVLDHIDDAADHAPIIGARNTVRQRKMRRDPRLLLHGKLINLDVRHRR